MKLHRVIINTVTEGVIKTLLAVGVSGETITALFPQQYGFASSPKADSEAIIATEDGVSIAITTDDIRYRITLAAGEVALYSDEGDKIHFKRGRIVDIVAGTKIRFTAPEVEFSGKVSVAGDVESGGDIKDSQGTVAALRIAYDAHTHTVPGGVSGPAVPQV